MRVWPHDGHELMTRLAKRKKLEMLPPEHSSTSNPPSSRSFTMLWLLFALSLLFVWSYEAHLLSEERSQADRRGRAIVAGMADSLAMRASRVFQDADMMTRLAVGSGASASLAPNQGVRSVIVRSVDARMSVTLSLGAAHPAAGEELDPTQPVRGLDIDSSRRDPLTALPRVLVTRRSITGATGPTAEAVVDIPAADLTDGIYVPAEQRNSSLLSIFRDDGQVVLYRIGSSDVTSTISPVHTYESLVDGGPDVLVDPVDQISRIVASRRVPGFPMRVVAGVSQASVLAQFRAMRDENLFKAAIASLVLAAFFIIIANLMRRLVSNRDRLKLLSETDPLTNLYNRRWLNHCITAYYARKARTLETLSLVYVDLNDFKRINDHLGHDAGDILLVKVADRLRKLAGPDANVARIGGDEYCIVIDSLHAYEHAQEVAAKIAEEAKVPYVIAGRRYQLDVSIGIASSTPLDTSKGKLLRRVDLAMFEAKTAARGSGRSAIRVYSEAMGLREEDSNALAHDLNCAIGNGDISARLEPIVDAREKATVGYEVQAQWQHAADDALSPRTFAALAEEEGVMQQIGNMVLAQACEQWVALERDSNRPLVLSFNVSEAELLSPDLGPSIEACIAKYGISFDRLQIEVPENALVTCTQIVRDTLEFLRARGARIALSQFGVAGSTFDQLQSLPFSAIKINERFTRGIPFDKHCVAAVQSSIALARGLGLTLFVQGIDRQEQHDWFEQYEGVLVQGRLYTAR
jgi:diguanylate cyclase (GGDEF)-like protein